MIFSLNGLSIPIIDINIAGKGQKVLKASTVSILHSYNQKIVLPTAIRDVKIVAKGHNKYFHRMNWIGMTNSYK